MTPKPVSTLRHGRFTIPCLAALVLLGPFSTSRGIQAGQSPSPAPGVNRVRPIPTARLPIPADEALVWLVPRERVRLEYSRSPALTNLARGVTLIQAGRFAEALSLVGSPALASTPLAKHAAYYTGLAQLRLARLPDARQRFAALVASQPAGYLSQSAVLGGAEAAEAQGDFRSAADLYEGLSAKKIVDPDEVLFRLARAAELSGDRSRAVRAYLRLYYEFPLTDIGASADVELARLKGLDPIMPSSERYALELGRAERLFGARKYANARQSFVELRSVAAGDDRDLVDLRLAECDHYLRRYQDARAGLWPYLDRGSRVAEARFFYLTATRETGARDEYVRLSRELVERFPDSSWAEETLNNLATHYILDNDDEQANGVFRELSERFPSGRFAERAAWKAGWWAYKNGRYDEATRRFEEATAAFPRSDYRPSFLYWAARARDRLGDRASANARYAILTIDYLNSYYGRLAARTLDGRGERVAPVAFRVPERAVATTGSSESGSEEPDAGPPPTAELIRTLLAVGLYDEAINELVYAQRMWGDSPMLQATLGWAYAKTGDFRRGINAVKRAYPQYLSAAGSTLPPELLKVLFPLEYWPLIRQHSVSRNLDPYLVAALVAQESTFIPDIKSHANAIGLMQIVPLTGRRYARVAGVRRYSTALLSTPDANVRIGTAYFADLIRRFGGSHLALASYNAGEYRVGRWIAERPGLDRDEFIDDIPFPETQNYVKKILGSAEDYRRLYAAVAPAVPSRSTGKPAPTPVRPAPPTRRPH